MPTTALTHATGTLDAPGDTPQCRIDAALRLLTAHVSTDGNDLSLALLAVLDPPSGEPDAEALPSCPPSAVLAERVANHLAACWPRLAYGDFSTELAGDAMHIVTPVIDQLQEATGVWRRRAVATMFERDRARDVAVALEQVAAEAVRLLRAGRLGEALAVLESDGQPLDPAGDFTRVLALELDPQHSDAKVDPRRQASKQGERES